MLPRNTASLFNASGRKTGISLALNGSASTPATAGANLSMREKLSARSRVTNLGVVLLLATCAVSVLLNMRYMLLAGFDGRFTMKLPPPGFGVWETFHGFTPETLKRMQPEPALGADKLNHLVVVAGHAIWAGCNFGERENDENWVLESYQKGGSVRTFWKHIEKGLEMADADPTALLIFSGGQTRGTSLQTEAESYFSLALSSHMRIPVLPGFNETLTSSGHDTPAEAAAIRARIKSLKNSKVSTADYEEVMGTAARVGSGAASNAGVAVAAGLHGVRMTTENFALDSYQNLLFSVARFREFTGRYPSRISVVGYGIKKARFEELHAKAIRWPLKGFTNGQRRWHYIGIDDEHDTKEMREAQIDGERLKGYRPFERDMYGCQGVLLAKRQARNPTRRHHPYFSSAPELADLLAWCPGDGMGLQGIYPLSLPWDLRVTTDGWGRGAKRYREQHGGGGVGGAGGSSSAGGSGGTGGGAGMGAAANILPDTRWLEINREPH